MGSDVAHGWNGRPVGNDGKHRGLTGRELCQAAWAGAFAACGAKSKCEGPLLLVAIGARPGALGKLLPPQNAIVVNSVPQVDVLRIGVDAFLTHGGQNSFTEAMVNATPVVVCPGFGDQIINGRKAVALGVGLNVERPDCKAGEENGASSAYSRDVAAALTTVLTDLSYDNAVRCVSAELKAAGGTAAAARIILNRAKELLLDTSI